MCIFIADINPELSCRADHKKPKFYIVELATALYAGAFVVSSNEMLDWPNSRDLVRIALLV